MELNQREVEVICDILKKKGITSYEVLLDAPEGSIPRGLFPKEVHAWSGFIVTASNIYYFWLDWYEGHYTLGDEEGYWEEVTLEQLTARERELTLKFQRALQGQSGKISD